VRVSEQTMATRISLLVCDTPLPVVVANHGRYPEIFERLLLSSHPALADKSEALDLRTYDVIQGEYPPKGEEGAIMITGSGTYTLTCHILLILTPAVYFSSRIRL
jgi:hypothetical protein